MRSVVGSEWPVGRPAADGAGAVRRAPKIRSTCSWPVRPRPPTLATTAPVGGYSTYGDPRLRRVSLSVRARFGG